MPCKELGELTQRFGVFFLEFIEGVYVPLGVSVFFAFDSLPSEEIVSWSLL